jgi:hypothetical protein
MFPFIDLVNCINYSVTWGFEIVWIFDIALSASFLKKPFSLTDLRKSTLINGLTTSAETLLRFWFVNI